MELKTFWDLSKNQDETSVKNLPDVYKTDTDKLVELVEWEIVWDNWSNLNIKSLKIIENEIWNITSWKQLIERVINEWYSVEDALDIIVWHTKKVIDENIKLKEDKNKIKEAEKNAKKDAEMLKNCLKFASENINNISLTEDEKQTERVKYKKNIEKLYRFYIKTDRIYEDNWNKFIWKSISTYIKELANDINKNWKIKSWEDKWKIEIEILKKLLDNVDIYSKEFFRNNKKYLSYWSNNNWIIWSLKRMFFK